MHEIAKTMSLKGWGQKKTVGKNMRLEESIILYTFRYESINDIGSLIALPNLWQDSHENSYILRVL